MQPVFAQATVVPQHPGDAGYDELIATATAPVRDAFGQHVTMDVERLDRLGRWVFLQGTLRGADGHRPDYSGTHYAERAEQGGMSDVYVALLRATAAPDSPGASPDASAVEESPGDADTHASTSPDAVVEGPWTLVDHSIGPSDVSWLTWPQDHAAPRHLFGF